MIARLCVISSLLIVGTLGCDDRDSVTGSSTQVQQTAQGTQQGNFDPAEQQRERRSPPASPPTYLADCRALIADVEGISSASLADIIDGPKTVQRVRAHLTGKRVVAPWPATIKVRSENARSPSWAITLQLHTVSQRGWYSFATHARPFSKTDAWTDYWEWSGVTDEQLVAAWSTHAAGSDVIVDAVIKDVDIAQGTLRIYLDALSAKPLERKLDNVDTRPHEEFQVQAIRWDVTATGVPPSLWVFRLEAKPQPIQDRNLDGFRLRRDENGHTQSGSRRSRRLMTLDHFWSFVDSNPAFAHEHMHGVTREGFDRVLGYSDSPFKYRAPRSIVSLETSDPDVAHATFKALQTRSGDLPRPVSVLGRKVQTVRWVWREYETGFIDPSMPRPPSYVEHDIEDIVIDGVQIGSSHMQSLVGGVDWRSTARAGSSCNPDTMPSVTIRDALEHVTFKTVWPVDAGVLNLKTQLSNLMVERHPVGSEICLLARVLQAEEVGDVGRSVKVTLQPYFYIADTPEYVRNIIRPVSLSLKSLTKQAEPSTEASKVRLDVLIKPITLLFPRSVWYEVKSRETQGLVSTNFRLDSSSLEARVDPSRSDGISVAITLQVSDPNRK